MVRVSEFMTAPVVVVKPSDSLARARRLMIRYRIGRLIVIDEKTRPIGIITKADIASALINNPSKSLDQLRVENAMTADVITITENSSIKEAARIMLEKKISGLPVVDSDGRLVGIITKTDLVEAYVKRRKERDLVEEFMEKEFPVVSPTHSVHYVAELIEKASVRRVLVVDAGRLIGIIAPSDLAFATTITSPRQSKKYIRRFEELDKGRLGPVYTYIAPIAADIMTPDPITVQPKDYLVDAAILMLNNDISSIPVVVDEEPVGIVTKHSILEALLK